MIPSPESSSANWKMPMGVDGHSWKRPRLSAPAHLDANTSYPQQGIIACEIVRRSRDAAREIVRISSERPWFVESVDGLTEFDVLPDALVEFNW